jgi:hypothetical protein
VRRTQQMRDLMNHYTAERLKHDIRPHGHILDLLVSNSSVDPTFSGQIGRTHGVRAALMYVREYAE